MDDIVSLIIIGILIALTAFFVASEFAIVRVRSSRIDQLIAEGNKKAVRAKQVVSDLDEYLSACQARYYDYSAWTRLDGGADG